MENVTELIKSIDSLSFRVTLLSGFLVFAYVSIVAVSIFSYFKNLPVKSELGDPQKLFELGCIDTLAERCKELLAEKPNHVEAHWYLAICHYQKGDFTEALEQFEKLETINPCWADEIEPYRLKIYQLSDYDHPVTH